jgi:hypothetical protein
MISRLRKRLRTLWQDTTGVAAVEAALLLPVLLTTFIGCTEVTFKIWSTQKVEKLSVTIADVLTQSQTISVDGLEQVVMASDRIMDPFPFETEGMIFISSVYVKQGETVPKINWQCHTTGASFSALSKLGLKDEPAVLPTELQVLAERDNVIVAEIYYKYTPIMPGLMFDEGIVYRRAFFKPRLGALTNSPGDPCELTI